MKGILAIAAALAAAMSFGTAAAQANVTPTINAPASFTVNEDTTLYLGLSFADADAGGNQETVTLSVDSGTLSTSDGNVTVTGSGTSTLTLRGSISALNNTFSVAGVGYRDAANANGARTLQVKIDDEGNTGGTPETAETDVPLNVTAVNDAPEVPGLARQTVDQNGTLVLSSAGHGAFRVTDVDAAPGNVQLTLSVAHGALTLAGTSGLSFTTGDGTADPTITFQGTLSDVNTALDGLTYAPSPGYYGNDSVQATADDLGNTGSGGAKTFTGAAAVFVQPPFPYITDLSFGQLGTDGQTFGAGSHILISATFNRPVSRSLTQYDAPALLLNTTPFPARAEYYASSGSNMLFDYTVQPGDNAATLDAASGAALELNGGSITATDTGLGTLLTTPFGGAAGSLASHHVTIATGSAATVTGLDVPADGTYGTGAALDVKVHYDRAVTVTGGTPKLTILGGGLEHDATLVAGSGTDTLTFRYTVRKGDTTAAISSSGPGIKVRRAITLNGATIADGSANPASPRVSTNDTALPDVELVTTSAGVDSFVHADDLSWTLTFSRAMTGVDPSDFDVVTTGAAQAASLSVEAGADGKTYKITLHGISGEGSYAPRLKDAGTGIADSFGNPLEGGATGDAYTPPSTLLPPARPLQPQTPLTPQPPVKDAPAVKAKPRLKTVTLASSCTRSKTLGLTLAGTGAARVEVRVVSLRTSAKQRGCNGLGALKTGKAVATKRLTLKSGTNRVAFKHGLKPGAYVVTFTPIAADGTRGAAVTRRIRILK